ncbi:glycosyltransferase family 39 protein, partial [bacterium]|nr:glycosyltransferase family 39 protein [bacterium]
LLILCSSLLVLIAGLTSVLSLGDEVYHYRFAKDIFNAGRRVAFDPLYGSANPPGYFYNSDPLWHILLASFWRLTGGISPVVAQVYHTIYYALLIFFTYLLGKELYGEREGLYAALIIATVPAVAVFSVLFYLDIPATSLSILCLLLIVKRRFLWSGIILGLMYLTKRNTCFFVPAFFFLLLYQTETNFREKVKNLFYLSVPAFLFVLPDFLWRENNLKSTIMISGGAFEGIISRLELKDWNLRTSEYLNSHLSDPVDIVKYFGIVLLITLAIYALFKIYEKKDLMLWLPVICYFLFFCYIFHPASDIRYLLPVVPLLAILSSKAIVYYWDKKWLKISLIILCLLQFSSSVLYVRCKRQIPKGIAEGFAYLRGNTAPDALIIYPEYVILEATNRRFAWAGKLRPVLKNLFWDKDEDRVRDLLISNDVGYIAIKKSRIYDDSKVHHFGGYPKSFVERLPKLFFVKLAFDNKDMSIWQVE